MEQLELLNIANGMQNATTLWKTIGQFLIRLSIHLSYISTIPPLGIERREMKTCIHTETCMWMLIMALFVIVPNWKQFKCPSTGEWMEKNVVYPDNVILFINKKKLLIHTNTWMDFKSIMLNKKNGRHKRLIHTVWFHLYEI